MAPAIPKVRSMLLIGVFFALVSLAGPAVLRGQDTDSTKDYIRDHYTKREYRISMRDGVNLFTQVYLPKDTSEKYPVLMQRTPYRSAPYGEDKYRESLGPSEYLAKEGYIFIYQDARGRFMSEGEAPNWLTPHNPHKQSKEDVDESSDMYDTIEWLLANLPNHNGKVGLWGISWPGFYAAASMIDAHPAIAAVSPQAPMSDFWFDESFHNGACFLTTNFTFLLHSLHAHPEPHSEWWTDWILHPDEYRFFLDLGPIRNITATYFEGQENVWNDLILHPNYDEFWQSQRILDQLYSVAPAVMTVGGWFDTDDLYGTFHVYQSIEEKNPGIFNILVVGPWRHGGWARDRGDQLGHIQFGSETSLFYQQNIELPFFNHYLKDKGEAGLPEMYGFITGSNQWVTFDSWPPEDLEDRQIYFHQGGKLSFDPPRSKKKVYDEYISDPANPVPYTSEIGSRYPSLVWPRYMIGDQRFADRRPDVLSYQTDALEEDITLAGPLQADLWVSTSGTDSDWIVKLIDVFPDSTENPEDLPVGVHMAGFQMMVRSEVIRGRFRNSFEQPEPFRPNRPTRVSFTLQDVLHTFQKGHRIMVQVQSTWFPMVDRNPQKYVDNIFFADEDDFIIATQRVYRSAKYPSCLQVGILPAVGH